MKLHILRKSHRGYNDKRRARERDDRSIFRFNETIESNFYIYIYIYELSKPPSFPLLLVVPSFRRISR